MCINNGLAGGKKTVSVAFSRVINPRRGNPRGYANCRFTRNLRADNARDFSAPFSLFSQWNV